MKFFLLLLLLLAGGFAFWKFNDTLPSDKVTDDGSITHIVVKGDTLSALARKHNTSVANIKKRNNLSNDVIHLGASLSIMPGAQTQKPVATTAKKQTPKKSPPKPKKVIAKKELPKSTVMESSSIGIDIDDKNQVYLKTKSGKFAPAGTIIYGSDADANGMEIKTITYRDIMGKETTLPGSADPESVIRLALKKR
ncbi:MAG: LysM domain-containing protein [Rubritalea sp.]|uniref:LysM peptidoglycan-binding domain-containing protein n=1 Tax=Rubritalea sp. TaxID=2109375 RepID=UPI003242065A